MLYQTFVTQYPSLGLPGNAVNNTRHTAISRSAVNILNDVECGTIQIKTGLYDHSRLIVQNPTAANTTGLNSTGQGNYAGIVLDSCATRASYGARAYIGTSVSSVSNVTPQFEHLRFLTNGIAYVICEKAINPSNPVYVRFQNAVGSLQKVGYVTDTASADVIAIPGAHFYGADSATYIASKDSSVTPALDRQRLGMSTGYGVVAVNLRFGASV